MTEIQQRRTSPNGVFGIKIHYSHIKNYNGFANVKKIFPDAFYILLSRKDVLKQAVSLSIAKQTGVWIAGQKPITDDPQYNFGDIDKSLRQTILANAFWRYTLAANGCNYIEMNFDVVRKNITASIQQVADFIGVDVDPALIPKEQVTKKQSTNINAEWEKQFFADYNGAELTCSEKTGLLKRIKNKIKNTLHA